MQSEEIEFLKKESLRSVSALEAAADEQAMYELSDEDVITIVNYLVKTRNKGEHRVQKAETLSQIKELLKKWL
jgi:hypothetical protein